MSFIKRIINHLLIGFQYRRIPNNNNAVFLTFDDGPEPGITEFVLDELAKYNFKATFFCRGDNVEKYPELLNRIKKDGHAIGNHTYSHVHSFNCNFKEYCADVDKADRVLNTPLFRPPHGSHTLLTFLRLKKRYKSYFWALNSDDSAMNRFDYYKSIDMLKNQTKVGDIVLFHFCHKHEKETRVLLPEYLKWLSNNGLCSQSITY